jgi:hypothetical protein
MGEEGEATMGKSFTESFESRGGWTPRSPTTAVVQREREMKERGKKEEEEEMGRLNRYRDKGASELADVARLRSQLDL